MKFKAYILFQCNKAGYNGKTLCKPSNTEPTASHKTLWDFATF